MQIILAIAINITEQDKALGEEKSPVLLSIVERCMAKRNNRANWKDLSKEQKEKIVKAKSRGATQNDIMREYGICSVQFCSILKIAYVEANEKHNEGKGNR